MTAANTFSFLGEINFHCFLSIIDLYFGMGFEEFNIYVMLAGFWQSYYNFNAGRKKNGLILYSSQRAWFTEHSKK